MSWLRFFSYSSWYLPSLCHFQIWEIQFVYSRVCSCSISIDCCLSPNYATYYLCRVLSMSLLLLWKLTFKTLSPFELLLLLLLLLLPLFMIVLVRFLTLSLRAFDFFKLFFFRKLPDPFSLLRRDDTRCGRWRMEFPRLRLCFVW